ncbi:MAG: mobile mystery protein B [Sphingobacteriaceae bacterium]|nr:mobile mystery protein B [Sphingobacteriaceae bacterium]
MDEFEQQNIEQAIQWSIARNFKSELVFTEAFVLLLHKRMYADVWAWAGKFRRSNKNIGVAHYRIATDLKQLLDDVTYWHINKTYTADEIAIRLKHRIVSIHCFANGRHSRLLADIVIDKIYKQPVFSWGATNLSNDGKAREKYLKAVKDADKGDYRLLIAFARS